MSLTDLQQVMNFITVTKFTDSPVHCSVHMSADLAHVPNCVSKHVASLKDYKTLMKYRTPPQGISKNSGFFFCIQSMIQGLYSRKVLARA